MKIRARIELDELVDADDFTGFSVVAESTRHVWVQRSTLLELAGDRQSDLEWMRSLDAMIAYAQTQGWVDESGAIRAHVEWVKPED